MTLVNKFNVNKQQVTLDADIIENMSANDVSYDASTQYNKNTVGDKLSELEYDVTVNNDGVTFASLSELLSSENLSTLIPVSVRCGGMSIRFVQSSDNKYVQYRLTKNTWSTDINDWSGYTKIIQNDEYSVPSNAAIFNEILRQTCFNEYLWTFFKIHYTHTGDGSYSSHDRRNAITSPMHFDKDIIVSVESGYRYAIQYFDGYEVGPSHLIQATPWYTNSQIIPANSYWCMIVAFVDNSTTSDSTTKVLTFAIEKYDLSLFTEKTKKYSFGLDSNLIIDNTAKTISLPNDHNLVCSYGNGYYKLSGGYSVSYENKSFSSTLVILQYNFDDNSLELNTYSEFNDKYPVVARLIAVYNTNNIINYAYSAVNILLNNSSFKTKEYDELFILTKGKLLTYNTIQIDNKDKTITLPDKGGNLIYKYGNGNLYKLLPNGYSMSYEDIVADGSLAYLYYDYDEQELKISTYRETFPKYPIIASLSFDYMTNNLTSVYDCKVPISINGKIFNQRESNEIKAIAEDIVKTDKPYSYSGEIVSLNFFDVKPFKTLSNDWSQSMAIYGDYVIFFSNSTNKAHLYNIVSGSLLATFDITNGGYFQPHCNTAMSGIEFASENSIMPVIYLSQWNAGHERACFVYDVSLNNDTYSLTLIQRINLSSVSSSLIGVGECDFIIDKQENKMYAIAYKASNTTSGQGISTLVCSLNLPLLSAGSVVTITDNDIISHFELDLIKYRQDAFMHNGKIYISYGGLSGVKAGIAVIDIETEKIVTQIPIYKYIDSEPECLDIYKNKLLYNYGSDLLEIIV